jgi:lipid-binding SYLF domain-containing protein
MEEKKKRFISVKKNMILAILTVGMVFATITSAIAADDSANTAQKIVDRAQVTLNDFMHDPKYLTLQANLDHAKGVLIFPEVVQGGLILGASGGTGVLLVRDEETGNWSQPSFFSIRSISIGVQIGGAVSEIVMLAMNQEAIDTLLMSPFTVGRNASIALGAVGAGAERNRVMPDVTGNFISFVKLKGLFAGLDLTGSYIEERNKLETAYYGKDITLEDIIVGNSVSNERSAALLESLKRAGGG